jgi:hypothetical protein
MNHKCFLCSIASGLGFDDENLLKLTETPITIGPKKCGETEDGLNLEGVRVPADAAAEGELLPSGRMLDV